MEAAEMAARKKTDELKEKGRELFNSRFEPIASTATSFDEHGSSTIAVFDAVYVRPQA